MLAMYVCFDNPTPMLADYPAAYEGQPGFDFLKQVPTWWDETRVLEGEIGELLVTARRKGDDLVLSAACPQDGPTIWRCRCPSWRRTVHRQNLERRSRYRL